MLAFLREPQFTKDSPKLEAVLRRWLLQLNAMSARATAKLELSRLQNHIPRTLSGLLMLTINLLTHESFTPELSTLVESLLEHRDKRVVSNALEVLTHFRVEASKASQSELLTSGDNRVIASALVQEGIRELSVFVIQAH